MKKSIFRVFVACSLLFVAACGSMPKHNEIRGDDQPTLFIQDNGIGSQLYVDGEYLGVIDDDNQLFGISTGNHNVRIVKPDGEVIQRTIFVQGNTRREISAAN